MKKLFGFLLCFGLFQQSAYALPGWSSQQLKSWVKTHKFLSPDTTEVPIPPVTIFTASRKLDGGKMLVINYERFAPSLTYPYASLYVLESIEEGVPTSHLDIWQRESSGSEKILKSVYGSGVAHDFRDSKLVFNGDEFNSECIKGVGVIAKIPGNCSKSIDKLASFQLFQGKLYGYEVSHFQSLHKLKIFPLDRINTWIDVERHNRKMYEKFKQVDDRRKPADLGL